jgi:hypothetical protein
MTQASPAARYPRLSGLLTPLGVLLAVAIGLELGVRIEDKIAFGTPLFSRYRNPEELLIRTRDGVHGRPNARYRNWIINGLGFRGPDADSAKGPGHVRVIASGASEMFGLYESPGKEIPRQLEDSLRPRLTTPACGQREVEVWNAALPGMGLPTVTQDLRLRIARFDPDVVVLYPTPAFYLGNKLPVAAPPDSTGVHAAPALGRALSPRSWSRVREQLKGLVPTPVASWLRARRVERVNRSRGAEWRYHEIPPDRVEAFEASLREVVGATRALGAHLVLATHGNAFAAGTRSHPRSEWRIAWERFHPRATAGVLIAFDSAAREAVFRVAADSGVTVADVARRVAESGSPGFADYAHFNDDGAAIAAGTMAEAVATALRDNEELGCPRRASR